MKKPDWGEGAKVEAWTIARLDAMDEDEEGPPRLLGDAEMAALEKSISADFSKRRKNWRRQRILAKLEHPRGRMKGEARPSDWADVKRWCCEEALEDLARIREIWLADFGRRNRGLPPLAEMIAAKRWGLAIDTLINFRKNRRRGVR